MNMPEKQKRMVQKPFCWLFRPFVVCSLQGTYLEGAVYPPRPVQAAQLRHEDGSHGQGHGHDSGDGRDGPGEAR